MLLRDLVERRMLRQVGIDHEDVEAASLRSNGRENALQIVQVSCVGADGVDAADLRLRQLPQLRFTAPRDEDLSPFLAEPVAMARPMPLAPPMTSATLFVNRFRRRRS